MKTIIFAVLLLASSSAAAVDYSDCVMKADAFKFAAHLREQGMSPQEALNVMQTNIQSPDQVALSQLKKIINQIYFDARFERAGGMALYNQMYDLCVNGPKNYKPLK